MEPAAKSQLVVPINFDSEWSTPSGLEVRVDKVHTRFQSYQVADGDDCADLDAEWLDFARDHPDCADDIGVFLEPNFEAFRKVDGDPSGNYENKQLDLAGYRPESVTVRVREGVVSVTASESETTSVVENKAIKCWKKLERKFTLPEGVSPDAICTKFTVDGRLIISVLPSRFPQKEIAAEEDDSSSLANTWNASDLTDVETDGSKSSIVDR
ncbi:uncharacterized protein [Dermacentor andersoni]|uniref:uncharacterized protein n=1 Tax=Dermacentor andersoni TaxID=34620 RepID=UPI0021551D7C|nr:uncharacterized protein LOC126547664 [Dermacentor andersoni]